MTEPEFQNLIKKDSYQVFLFTCPAFIPFNFACHSWFVINRKGSVSRWEVVFPIQKNKRAWGYLTLDSWLPTQGIGMLPYWGAVRWKSTLITTLEGGEGSVAEQMSAFIQDSHAEYPNSHTYNLLGPNSNTYTEWVLNKFPKAGMELPWNAIGKNCR